jgi:hypothetical protein
MTKDIHMQRRALRAFKRTMRDIGGAAFAPGSYTVGECDCDAQRAAFAGAWYRAVKAAERATTRSVQ